MEQENYTQAYERELKKIKRMKLPDCPECKKNDQVKKLFYGRPIYGPLWSAEIDSGRMDHGDAVAPQERLKYFCFRCNKNFD